MSEYDSNEESIAFDKEVLKEEIKALTKSQRMIIIKEYEKKVKEYGIGMKGFSEFMKWFDELED